MSIHIPFFHKYTYLIPFNNNIILQRKLRDPGQRFISLPCSWVHRIREIRECKSGYYYFGLVFFIKRVKKVVM